MDRLERAVDCSVVIVNYRTDEFLAECLASLVKTAGGPELEVIVVDNGATLAGGDLRERFPGVQLVENAGNVGFARAANQGIGRARGRHVLCLNPDTVVHDSAVTAMVAYLEAHPRVGAVGARLLESDGTLQYSCLRTRPRSIPSTGTARGGGLLPLDMPASTYQVRVIGLSATFLVIGTFSDAVTITIQ